MPEVGHWYFTELGDIGRAAKARQMVEKLHVLAPEAVKATYPDVAQALSAALRNCTSNDSIWVLGSFFTVAAALDYLAKGSDNADSQSLNS